jgi:hypothetical protein
MSTKIPPFDVDLLQLTSSDLLTRSRLPGVQRDEAIREMLRRLFNRDIEEKSHNRELEHAFFLATGHSWQQFRQGNISPLIAH